MASMCVCVCVSLQGTLYVIYGFILDSQINLRQCQELLSLAFVYMFVAF